MLTAQWRGVLSGLVYLSGLSGAAYAQSTTTTAAPPPPFVVTSEMTAHFGRVAPRLVRSAGLGPGKTAVVMGGAFLLPFMQQLALEVERAGAVAVMVVTNDSIERARDANLLARSSAQPNPLLSALASTPDVSFVFRGVEDLSMFSARTPVQQAAAAKIDSMSAPLYARHRMIFVGIPLPADAAANGYSPEEYTRGGWEAMDADFDRIAAGAESMRQRLVNARTVRITSPDGTDLSFSIVPREMLLDVGAVNTFSPGDTYRTTFFPAAAFNADVNEASANGKVRAPWDFCNTPVKNEAIDIDRGRVTNVRTETEEACVKKAISNLNFSFVSIGLNPTHPNDPSATRMATDFNSAGLVLIGLGDNTRFGGRDRGSPQWVIPLVRATVTADGAALVRDGKLVTN